MYSSNVSFGQRIPIMNCHIRDNVQNKFIPAVIAEFDCKDASDATTVFHADEDCPFRQIISMDMEDKFSNGDSSDFDNYKFYALELNNGHIVGLCQTYAEDDGVHVNFLASKRGKNYTYIGQALLAGIVKKELQPKKQDMIVDHSLIDAVRFYVEKCGFTKDGGKALKLKTDQQDGFIAKVQNKTHAPLIDIEV